MARPITFACLFLTLGPSGQADDNFLEEFQSMLESLTCTETFFSCADIGAEKCSEIASESALACPSSAVVEAMANALSDGKTKDEAIRSTQQYGLCYLQRFRAAAKRDDLGVDCVDEAVEGSLEAYGQKRVREKTQNRRN